MTVTGSGPSTLRAGTRLGPYEILAPIGAGGMGEVYRARDTRLDRSVAIKVLPPELSAHPDARARFEREARAVSSLNHPHICVLHDIGHQDGVDYLVMELLEGETLAARLQRGPLPADQAISFGIQIADALDRAHRSGIVHRDLKPGNIMITRGGAKLLDFGLARAIVPASAGGSTMNLSQSPTMTTPLTVAGSMVGTFQYMAPEQLEGQEADVRSDIWALGSVLYEMASGKRAFEGKSQASLIAAILERDPVPLASVQPSAPPGLDRLIRQCLSKNPEERIQTAHDVKLQLQWLAEGGSQAGVAAPVAAHRRGRERLAWGVAAVAALVALAFAGTIATRRAPAPRPMRFDVDAPGGVTTVAWPRLSPNGHHLAFLGGDSVGTFRIWLRSMRTLEAAPLPGTEGANRPFWSPDSRWLAFFSEDKLKKISITGGPPQLISDGLRGSDGTWGAGGDILFDNRNSDSLMRVSAAGGTPEPATYLDRKAGEVGHAWPYFLPDGRHFIYLALQANDPVNQRLKVGRVGSRESWFLGQAVSRVEYSPSGHLIELLDGGTLLARPFDLRAKRITGEAVPIAERVRAGNAQGFFSVSQRGDLAVLGELHGEQSELAWYDRTGRRLGVAAPPGRYADLSISPDGSQIAVGIIAANGREDLWVRHLARGVTSRLTFGDNNEVWPEWSPDGRRIVYSTDASGPFRLRVRQASGLGVEDSLPALEGGNVGPTCWSRDGRTILMRGLVGSSWDILTGSMDPVSKPVPWLATTFNEMDGTLSPDGRWIAYTSVESGRPEVYVQSFTGESGKWQVSTQGGVLPQWRADGRELFFRALDQSFMAVPIELGATFNVGQPVALFRASLQGGGIIRKRWQASADGQRLLLNVPIGQQRAPSITVATDWPAELDRK